MCLWIQLYRWHHVLPVTTLWVASTHIHVSPVNNHKQPESLASGFSQLTCEQNFQIISIRDTVGKLYSTWMTDYTCCECSNNSLLVCSIVLEKVASSGLARLKDHLRPANKLVFVLLYINCMDREWREWRGISSIGISDTRLQV